jgi:hypothetical protein
MKYIMTALIIIFLAGCASTSKTYYKTVAEIKTEFPTIQVHNTPPADVARDMPGNPAFGNPYYIKFSH